MFYSKNLVNTTKDISSQNKCKTRCIPKKLASNCFGCRKKFSFRIWRYRCGRCEESFCNECSNQRTKLVYLSSEQYARVCLSCKQREELLRQLIGGISGENQGDTSFFLDQKVDRLPLNIPFDKYGFDTSLYTRDQFGKAKQPFKLIFGEIVRNCEKLSYLVGYQENADCSNLTDKALAHGSLFLTNYRLVFIPSFIENECLEYGRINPFQSDKRMANAINIPVNSIAKLERYAASNAVIGLIRMTCKDIRRFMFTTTIVNPLIGNYTLQNCPIFNLMTQIIGSDNRDLVDKKDFAFAHNFGLPEINSVISTDLVNTVASVAASTRSQKCGIPATFTHHSTNFLNQTNSRLQFEIHSLNGAKKFIISSVLGNSIHSSRWRISNLNSNFDFCSSYPRVLVVPKSISDKDIKKIGNYRVEHRVPALVWLDQTTGASICRTSALSGKETKCCEDAKFIREMGVLNTKTNSVLIVDCRSHDEIFGGREGRHYYATSKPEEYRNFISKTTYSPSPRNGPIANTITPIASNNNSYHNNIPKNTNVDNTKSVDPVDKHVHTILIPEESEKDTSNEKADYKTLHCPPCLEPTQLTNNTTTTISTDGITTDTWGYRRNPDGIGFVLNYRELGEFIPNPYISSPTKEYPIEAMPAEVTTIDHHTFNTRTSNVDGSDCLSTDSSLFDGDNECRAVALCNAITTDATTTIGTTATNEAATDDPIRHSGTRSRDCNLRELTPPTASTTLTADGITTADTDNGDIIRHSDTRSPDRALEEVQVSTTTTTCTDATTDTWGYRRNPDGIGFVLNYRELGEFIPNPYISSPTKEYPIEAMPAEVTTTDHHTFNTRTSNVDGSDCLSTDSSLFDGDNECRAVALCNAITTDATTTIGTTATNEAATDDPIRHSGTRRRDCNLRELTPPTASTTLTADGITTADTDNGDIIRHSDTRSPDRALEEVQVSTTTTTCTDATTDTWGYRRNPNGIGFVLNYRELGEFIPNPYISSPTKEYPIEAIPIQVTTTDYRACTTRTSNVVGSDCLSTDSSLFDGDNECHAVAVCNAITTDATTTIGTTATNEAATDDPIRHSGTRRRDCNLRELTPPTASTTLTADGIATADTDNGDIIRHSDTRSPDRALEEVQVSTTTTTCTDATTDTWGYRRNPDGIGFVLNYRELGEFIPNPYISSPTKEYPIEAMPAEVTTTDHRACTTRASNVDESDCLSTDSLLFDLCMKSSTARPSSRNENSTPSKIGAIVYPPPLKEVRVMGSPRLTVGTSVVNETKCGRLLEPRDISCQKQKPVLPLRPLKIYNRFASEDDSDTSSVDEEMSAMYVIPSRTTLSFHCDLSLCGMVGIRNVREAYETVKEGILQSIEDVFTPSTRTNTSKIEETTKYNISRNHYKSKARRSKRCSWMKSFLDSNWLEQCSSILKTARTVIDAISIEGRSVLLHCSDGRDRTPQVLSIALLALEPKYRTLHGFQNLIDVHWVGFGHKFKDRTGSNATIFRYNDKVSPIFMQWIEVVWQLTQQFPKSFEFNEEFLLDILHHVNSCRFGNFLGNDNRERQRGNLWQSTSDLWNSMNTMNSKSKGFYMNPMFEEPDVMSASSITPDLQYNDHNIDTCDFPSIASLQHRIHKISHSTNAGTPVKILYPEYHLTFLRIWRGYFFQHEASFKDKSLSGSTVIKNPSCSFRTTAPIRVASSSKRTNNVASNSSNKLKRGASSSVIINQLEELFMHREKEGKRRKGEGEMKCCSPLNEDDHKIRDDGVEDGKKMRDTKKDPSTDRWDEKKCSRRLPGENEGEISAVSISEITKQMKILQCKLQASESLVLSLRGEIQAQKHIINKSFELEHQWKPASRTPTTSSTTNSIANAVVSKASTGSGDSATSRCVRATNTLSSMASLKKRTISLKCNLNCLVEEKQTVVVERDNNDDGGSTTLNMSKPKNKLAPTSNGVITTGRTNCISGSSIKWTNPILDIIPNRPAGDVGVKFNSYMLPMEKVFSKSHWIPDNESNSCYHCNKDFTFFNRRHHCRLCGSIVCGKCSTNRKRVGYSHKIRLCEQCNVLTTIKSA